jgi:nucleoside-diphosphate-sugar epimerase
MERMMANETILVTGASGQVGRRLVPRLLSWREPGERIKVLVRTAEAAERWAAAGAEAVTGDLREAADRERALDGATAVVQAAASFRGPEATEEVMAAVNRDAAVALAGEAAAAGSVRRFVHVSTNLVYGPGAGRPALEDDELRAGPGGYPGTKREAEQLLAALREETGFGVVTLRLAFVYGDGDPHIEESLGRFAGLAAHQRLPMAHHADVGQAVLRALRTPDVDGRTYNITDDAGSTVYELYELVGRRMDLAAARGRDVPDPWFGVTDTTRARRELGFSPLYPTARAAWRAGAL